VARESPAAPSLPPTTLVALAMGALGLFAVNKFSFHDTRPTAPPAPIYWHGPDELQDVEARQWEDPLGAVARVRAAQPDNAAGRHTAADLSLALAQHPPAVQIQVLGVFASGGPYPEDVENRRRSRYAVLAGLHRTGYVPTSAEHVGYFIWSDGTARPVAAVNAPSPAVVFEVFSGEEQRTEAPGRVVILLWLDEEVSASHPLANFSNIVFAITQGRPNTSAALLGPISSDGLRRMHQELKSCTHGASCPAGSPLAGPINVYSATATAADDWVLGDTKATCPVGLAERPRTGAVASQFELLSRGSVHLFRVVATDCAVSQRLYEELHHRGVQHFNEITLIAERDSLYARLMGKYFGGCYTVESAALSNLTPQDAQNHPICFTYQRGLDGQSAPAPHARDGGVTADENDDSKSKKSAPATAENATGASQLDYLRRLTTKISAGIRSRRCGSTHAEAGDCTRAIGVLGSDIYDKILILQAMRGAFPRAVFFTTDLDALLLDQEHLKWTRHLLVGSSFGLALRPQLQADIPPFRDTYQTASYLGTVLAMDREEPEKTAKGPSSAADTGPPPDVAEIQHRVDAWTSGVRMFEIGRSQAFDLTANSSLDACMSVRRCQSVHPQAVTSFWGDESRWTGVKVALYLIIVALLSYWVATSGIVCVAPPPLAAQAQPASQIKRSLGKGKMFGSGALTFVLIIVLVWPKLVEFGKTQETPVPVFGGASIWAGLMVEMLVIIAVVALTIRGQRTLKGNADGIASRFKLGKTTAQLIEFRDKEIALLSRRKWWKELFWIPIRSVSSLTPDAPGNGDLSALEHLIARYLHRGLAKARFARVSAATVVSVAALVLIDRATGTSIIQVGVLAPGSRMAGETAAALSFLGLLSIQFLVFWVADAMLLSRAFIIELCRDRPQWPETSLTHAKRDLQLATEPTTAWLNLRLAGARTRCVADLVWYPSLVLAAMAVASFTVEFGPYSFASNPICLVLSTLLLIVAAAYLRLSAESLRSTSMDWLQDLRSRALSSQSPKEAEAEQLDHLIERAAELKEGAFASYSQQPLVKALLVPAATYGAALLAQYLQIGLE
jgi:hypothetical protein